MSNIQVLPLSYDFSNPHDKSSQLSGLHFFQKYYAEYYGEAFADFSFYLANDNGKVINVLCYKINDQLCWPLDGVKADSFNAYSKSDAKEIANIIVNHVEAKANESSCAQIVIKDTLPEGKLSTLGEVLFNAKYHSKITYEMLIDFQGFSENAYYKTIRKSYKSLINWGKKNLNINIINKENLSLDEFLAFKQFHHKISGRQTRSDASWNIQYQMIEQGIGELILAYYQDNLVAGSLFMDQYDISMYFTGVYERDLFEFGLSHYLLYLGVCRSYERGMTKHFSLGNFETDIIDPKWYNIQFFKKGFCQTMVPTLLWHKIIEK